jgi:glutaredoxin 3
MSPTKGSDDFCTLGLAADQGDQAGDAPAASQGEGARIYGKEGCPHTKRARAAWPRALFVDVLADPAALEEMLRLSGGVRRIPVIVHGDGRRDAVEIGFKRGA